MTLKRRLDKLEPVIEAWHVKRLVALVCQEQVMEGLIRLYNALPAADYARAEAALVGHLREVLQDAFGDSWARYLWIASEETP
jgi:hypothetical protein